MSIRLGGRFLCGIALFLTTPLSSFAQTGTRTEVFFSQVYDHNKTRAKNNPKSIDRMLAAFIRATKSSLDAALYEIHNDRVIDALIETHKRLKKAKKRGVRLVSDHMYRYGERTHACPRYKDLEAAKIPIVYDNLKGYMHNKFYIRDESCVWTGSFNAVDKEAWQNHNNAIKVCNSELAKRYKTEFWEMFRYKKFGAKSPKNTPSSVIKKSRYVTLQQCFSPEGNCGQLIMSKLAAAKKKIRIMTFSISDFVTRGPQKLSERKKLPTFKSVLLQKKAEGLDIKVLVEYSKSRAKGSLAPTLQEAGIAVKADSNPALLHSKVIMIDNKIVITGSYNFSREADYGNDENILIISSTSVGKKYDAEFNRIWKKGKAIAGVATCDKSKPVDINTATLTAISKLPGMGWRGAQVVKRNRPYCKIGELVTKGSMYQSKFDRLKLCVTVKNPPANCK